MNYYVVDLWQSYDKLWGTYDKLRRNLRFFVNRASGQWCPFTSDKHWVINGTSVLHQCQTKNRTDLCMNFWVISCGLMIKVGDAIFVVRRTYLLAGVCHRSMMTSFFHCALWLWWIVVHCKFSTIKFLTCLHHVKVLGIECLSGNLVSK